jgi:hypothetical protein
MSKFVQIKTELRDLALVKRALDDLKISYQEKAPYVHPFGGFRGQVPILVKERRASFGLRESGEGVYEIIGDDMQMAQIRAIMAPVQQRYAYHKVLAETERAGFNLVEESVGKDNVIRMTVRRWE